VLPKKESFVRSMEILRQALGKSFGFLHANVSRRCGGAALGGAVIFRSRSGTAEEVFSESLWDGGAVIFRSRSGTAEEVFSESLWDGG
jgi:hypothetical protein